MMPKLNGLELMKIIREKSTVPIIIMSAKDTDVDKALGLGFGADDYISKPFSLIEISARIESILRRVTKYSNLNSLVPFLVYSLSASFIGLIPLFFGMRKKSVPTTILSSIIIIIFAYSHIKGLSLGGLKLLPVVLAVVGLLVSCMSIRNIENHDLIN